jgi:hypothetical protein
MQSLNHPQHPLYTFRSCFSTSRLYFLIKGLCLYVSIFDIIDFVGDLRGEFGDGDILSFGLDLSLSCDNTDTDYRVDCILINLFGFCALPP